MDELRKMDKDILAAVLIMALDPNICAKEKNDVEHKRPFNEENFEKCVLKEMAFLTPAQYVDKYFNKN